MNSVIRQLLAAIMVAGAFRTAQIAAVPVVLSQQLLSWWASSAVDAKGGRHQAKDYPKEHAPWMDDVVKKVQPDYSKFDQMRRNGRIWFVSRHARHEDRIGKQSQRYSLNGSCDLR